MELQNLRQLACDRYEWVVHGFEDELEAVCHIGSRTLTVDQLCRTVSPCEPHLIRPIVHYAIWHDLLTVDWASPIDGDTVVEPSSRRRG